jgi:hypothetical protein
VKTTSRRPTQPHAVKSGVRNLKSILTTALAALCLTTSALAAGTLTGVVTNKTTGKPSPGDEVVLLSLIGGMQEAGHTTSDAQGHFSLDIPDNGMHLVRVVHDKAPYFAPVTPGTTTVNVDVFNASAKVAGVTTEADTLHVQTDPGNTVLEITENFFVKNESTPPMTQYGDHPYEFYLAPGATVVASAAQGPAGMAVQASPMPVPGSPGHYAFIFPVRPGETRFQIRYTLPYKGSLKFTPHPISATNYIVVMPKSMTFKPTDAGTFVPDMDVPNALTFVARVAQPAQPLEFTVSGSGQLPREEASDGSDAQSGAQTSAAPEGGAPAPGAAPDNRPGGGLGPPIDAEGTNDPWAKYKFWILGGLGLLLAAGAGILLKTGQPNAPRPASDPVPVPVPVPFTPTPTAGSPVLAALKDELFTLETDRLEGRIDEQEYAQHKAAIETLLKRALSRNPGA